MSRLLPWLRLLAGTAVRQRSRHREFRFRFLPPRQERYRVQVRARHGAFFAQLELRRDSSDLRGFEQIFLRDFYNLRASPAGPGLARAYGRLRRPLILDVGANIGLSALYFAHQWPGAHILAVEPAAANFAQLQRNLKPQASVGGCDLVQAAVAEAPGFARIVNPDGASAGYRTAPAGAAEPGAVPALTIPELMRRAPACDPFLLKLDVEGAEVGLFGAPAWLEAFPVLVIEPHDWLLPGSFQPCLEALARSRRRILVLGESLVAVRGDVKAS